MTAMRFALKGLHKTALWNPFRVRVRMAREHGACASRRGTVEAGQVSSIGVVIRAEAVIPWCFHYAKTPDRSSIRRFVFN